MEYNLTGISLPASRQAGSTPIPAEVTGLPVLSQALPLWYYRKTQTLKKAIVLFALFYFAALASFGQTKSMRNIVIWTLDFDYLEACETGKGECKPIEIVRETKQDSVLLVFPNSGTVSDVYLRSNSDRIFELHDIKSTGQGKPTLNLTKLKDGEYAANIVSCGLGGSCLIRLKTKSK